MPLTYWRCRDCERDSYASVRRGFVEATIEHMASFDPE
jgi:hypothetical protein